MQLIPYLNFGGDAQEALAVYTEAFAGKVEELHFYSENSELAKQFPGSCQNMVMHATFRSPDIHFMASDITDDPASGCNMSQRNPAGSTVSLSLNSTSLEEQQRVFDVLARDAQEVTMPLQDTFWGARFGMLTDKFGIKWVFNYDYPVKS
jgi:PhnB protein